MPAVSANQNRDRPVRTRPLSGIAVGRTTSKALMPVRRDEQQPVVVERVQVADLAGAEEAQSASSAQRAASDSAASRRVESGDDGGDVAQERGVVEAGVELGRGDSAAATAGSTASRSRSGARSSAARSAARWTIA